MAKEATQKELFYDQAYKWVLENGPHVVIGVLVLVFGWWIITLISRWIHRGMSKREVDPTLKPFLISLLLTAMRVLLIILVMGIIGIPTTIFVTVVGAFGVAGGLALSGTLQNFASGVLILLLKPFTVGDIIVAQGQEGTITSIQIFYTVMTTFDNRTVVLPNSKLSNEVIINISKKGIRRMDIDIKVSYKTDYQKVNKIIAKTIAGAKDMLKKPDSRIGIASFDGEFYIVNIAVWVKAHGFIDTKLHFQEKVLKDLADEKITLGK